MNITDINEPAHDCAASNSSLHGTRNPIAGLNAFGRTRRLQMAAALAGLLLLPAVARAGTSTYIFEGSNYNSPDWTLRGNASWDATAPSKILLTPNTIAQSGTAWLNTRKISPTSDWTFWMRGGVGGPFVGGGGWRRPGPADHRVKCQLGHDQLGQLPGNLAG